MDIVLVGLPGTGKTEVGRRLAARLGGTFVDTDHEIEHAAGRSIEALFGVEGESAFRALEREAIARLGGVDPTSSVTRVIATGAGAVVDPRNRWRLYRSRRAYWLEAPTDLLADRLRRSPTVRPLLAGSDVADRLGDLGRARERCYAAAQRIEAAGTADASAAAIVASLATPAPVGTALLRATLAPGRFALGEGFAAGELDAELRRQGARRVVLVTEPGAREAAGFAVEAELRARGWRVDLAGLPQGEAAKRLEVIEGAARELARLGLERDEPLVALGGGALTDAAGFLAATYQRGVPWIAVPTTMLGQLDAAIGGKTAVDIDAGKNLLGAFHPPAAVIADTAFLATLDPRHRRAGLAEAVKDGVLGDERLLEVLEQDGAAIAVGSELSDPSALAEVVERAAWVKITFVEADPVERGDRIALNLGHTLGHAIEATAGFGPVLHGEAVAYGLRAAGRIGQALGVTPTERADRIERVLDSLSLAIDPLPYPLDEVLDVLGTDKKRRTGALRWVLPTGDGWTVSDAVPMPLVRDVAASVLAGRAAAVGAGR